jgi:hypothetical protein
VQFYVGIKCMCVVLLTSRQCKLCLWFVVRKTVPKWSWMLDPVNETSVLCSGIRRFPRSMNDSVDLCHKLLKTD